MNKMYGYLRMALSIMMMSENNFARESVPGKHILPKKLKKVIPNGCEEYHFTRSGHFDTTNNKWNDIDYIFSCIASNSKSAIKKFEKFKNKKL